MKHGASAYVNHACRCPVCTAGNTSRVRAYRKRRMAMVPTDANGTTPGTTEKLAPATRERPGAVAHEETAS